MPTNKNTSILYKALNKCFREKYHLYARVNLIDKCEEIYVYYNGVADISRRQIFENFKFIESVTSFSTPILHRNITVFY